MIMERFQKAVLKGIMLIISLQFFTIRILSHKPIPFDDYRNYTDKAVDYGNDCTDIIKEIDKMGI
jgi:hypothetical protein